MLECQSLKLDLSEERERESFDQPTKNFLCFRVWSVVDLVRWEAQALNVLFQYL